MPPSYAESLLPFNLPALPLADRRSGAITFAIGSTSKTGPLSLKNTMIVSSRSPEFSIALIIFPISLSKEKILAAYFLS